MSCVINIFGGPCSGKSTTAAGLFHMMKVAGYSVEYASEWIKSYMYEEREYPVLDQLYTLAHQTKLIRETYNKVDFVITDSPILISVIYNEFYRQEIKNNPYMMDSNTNDLFEKFTVSLFNSFNNVNIFIDRIPYDYDTTGRNQKLDEALKIDNMILRLLESYKVIYRPFQVCDRILLDIHEYIMIKAQTSSIISDVSKVLQ